MKAHTRSNPESSKRIRTRLKSAFLVVIVGAAAAYSSTVLATPPSGLTNTPLARGTNTSNGTVPLQFGTDVAMAEITVAPGGSSGWHSHPGGAIVVVKSGSLTVYQSLGNQCTSVTYGAGQAFIERPGEVDDVFNYGTVPYDIFVTFPRVPQGDSARIDEPNPGTCGF